MPNSPRLTVDAAGAVGPEPEKSPKGSSLASGRQIIQKLHQSKAKSTTSKIANLLRTKHLGSGPKGRKRRMNLILKKKGNCW